MANSFINPTPTQHKILEQKYNSSRMNLLLVVVFTAINLVLLVTNSDSYFLFSAFIPYFITTMGMLLCGRFPAEFYGGEYNSLQFFGDSFFMVLLVISIVLMLLYLLAWFMSRKQRVGWLIFALVFFGLDTIGMLFINGFSVESIIDIVFHGWVIYYLILGISSHYKLKKLPLEEEISVPFETATQEALEENVEPVVSDTPEA